MTMDMRNAQGIAMRAPAYVGQIHNWPGFGRIFEIRETIGMGELVLRVELDNKAKVVPLIEEAGFRMTGHWRTVDRRSARVPLRKI